MLNSESKPTGSADPLALLEFIERPAVAMSPQGELLAGNAGFDEFCASLGVETPGGLTDILSETSSRAVTTARGDTLGALFLDGVNRPVRVMGIDLSPGRSAIVLVLVEEAPTGHNPSHAELRHDLAGPLTAILGTAELLLIRGRDLPDDVRGSVDQILENCARMSEILAQSRLRERNRGRG